MPDRKSIRNSERFFFRLKQTIDFFLFRAQLNVYNEILMEKMRRRRKKKFHSNCDGSDRVIFVFFLFTGLVVVVGVILLKMMFHYLGASKTLVICVENGYVFVATQ